MRLTLATAVFLVGIGGWAVPPDTAVLAFRQRAALSLPQWDETIAQSCHQRAVVLAESGTLSHADARGRGPGVQMVAQGVAPGEFGEVLGAGGDWDAVWTAWLASPSHRAVLNEPGWTRWAWGSADRGESTVWVLRFWKP